MARSLVSSRNRRITSLPIRSNSADIKASDDRCPGVRLAPKSFSPALILSNLPLLNFTGRFSQPFFPRYPDFMKIEKIIGPPSTEA
jgi:hypothetical protein